MQIIPTISANVIPFQRQLGQSPIVLQKACKCSRTITANVVTSQIHGLNTRVCLEYDIQGQLWQAACKKCRGYTRPHTPAPLRPHCAKQSVDGIALVAALRLHKCGRPHKLEQKGGASLRSQWPIKEWRHVVLAQLLLSKGPTCLDDPPPPEFTRWCKTVPSEHQWNMAQMAIACTK